MYKHSVVTMVCFYCNQIVKKLKLKLDNNSISIIIKFLHERSFCVPNWFLEDNQVRYEHQYKEFEENGCMEISGWK